MNYITFKLEPNEDTELTCVLCGSWKCELMFVAHVSHKTGRRSWFGVHEKCASTWREKVH